jgi:hypothetical protein
MRTLRRITIISAAITSLVFLGAVALASIPDSSGVIHGCRKNSDGSLRVIDTDAGQTCPKGYTTLDWRQNGYSEYQIAETQHDIPANYASDKVTVAAWCPSGMKPLGGGGVGPEVDGGAWVLYQSAPLNNAGQPVGWYVRLLRVGPAYGSATTAFAYAVCANTAS